MKICIRVTLLLPVLIIGTNPTLCWSQDFRSIDPSGNARPLQRDASAELSAIRAEAQAFVDAFNRGDAKGVAAMWAEDGDYTDEAGQAYRGRDAIEHVYAAYFAGNPKAQIRIAIDSLRILGDSAAIEDGRAIVDPATGVAPTVGRYTAVHVKVAGKWHIATVRETGAEMTSAHHGVADLEWLIGTWTAEEHGARTEATCRWIANKSFVERSYQVTHADGSATSGVQLIGFNPEVGQIQSWIFTSDGGNASGVWMPREQGWTVELRGVTGKGILTTAINLLTRLDENAYVWQSVKRKAGENVLPDTEEVVLRRGAIVDLSRFPL